jgi:hypothetical protein
MRVVFELSGTILFETFMEQAPEAGAVIRIRTSTYKKGLPAESVIDVEVGAEEKPEYEGETLYISVNGYKLVEEGPQPSVGRDD